MSDLIWLVRQVQALARVKAPWRGALPPPSAIAGTAAEEAEVAAAFGEAKGGLLKQRWTHLWALLGVEGVAKERQCAHR